jgi:predicted nuclease of restriction endonuclease-like (RecB) superfamily
MNKGIQTDNEKLQCAVAEIKEAILQGQYEAAKGVNRIQLAVYFGIGKYISQHTRKGVWGTGALETISEQLRRELPGLRGYSATQMREMRLFYEAWLMLDANSSVATDELEKTASAFAKTGSNNSSVATDELQIIENHIDVRQAIQIPNITEFPIEDFFKVPFTQHTRIIASEKTLDARYYYIHRTAEEHLSVDDLKKLIKNDAYGHREKMPSNFTKTISNADMMRKAVMMFKDEYLLDFINVEEIGVRDKIDVDERVVEKEIVNKVKNFIMTIGRDFTFMGNQQLLEV